LFTNSLFQKKLEANTREPSKTQVKIPKNLGQGREQRIHYLEGICIIDASIVILGQRCLGHLQNSSSSRSSSSVQAKKWGSGILTEVIIPQRNPQTSSKPAAAYFHELTNVKTTGLESLASGLHI